MGKDDTEKEGIWTAGFRAACRQILGVVLSEMKDDPARAVLELHDARVQAKMLCELIGVEYDPDLNLADLIEKRIGRAVDDKLHELRGDLDTVTEERDQLRDRLHPPERAAQVVAPSTYLTIAYPRSELRQALDLIGPAQDEQHFQARLHVARLMVLAILRSHDNRIIRRDPVTKQLDTREIEAALAEACAGTEFTAKVLQPDNATRLVVDLDPKRFATAPDYGFMGLGTYAHDCDQCTPLGAFTVDAHTSDLYFCAKSVPTVIARYGNGGQDYESGLGMKSPPLVEAERRARERGLL